MIQCSAIERHTCRTDRRRRHAMKMIWVASSMATSCFIETTSLAPPILFVPPTNFREIWPEKFAQKSPSLAAINFNINQSVAGRDDPSEKNRGIRPLKGRARTKRKAPPNKRKLSKSTANSKGASSAEKGVELRSELISDGEGTYIQFSRPFQRHVAYKRNPPGSADEVLRSFRFLDEAVKSFPRARVLAPRDLPFPPPSCNVIYPEEGGSDDGVHWLSASRGRSIDTNVEEEECETTIAGMGLWTVCQLEYDGIGAPSGDPESQHKLANDALRTLLRLVSSESRQVVPRHFFRLDPRRLAMRGHTAETIMQNHFRVTSMLSRGVDSGLAMDPADVAFVLQNFPQLCLYNSGELEELVSFLLRPLPPAGEFPSVAMVADRGGGKAFLNEVDWPSLSSKGYGAGLNIDQATNAIRVMPELLSLYFEDSRKPSMIYLYNQMIAPISAKLIDEANVQLSLEGNDPSDTYIFAYLRSLGVTWGQLRVLVSALPLWTTVGLEPGWELVQKGPVRSMLKRPALDYLRQRLQIGPGDVYGMLKTHSRLSTYDGCSKILPTLDEIQSRLGLSSFELRKLLLRMPSLTGMGTSSFINRLEFFKSEVDISIGNLREAVMKQPSLLQYGVASTLRPKLRFFLDELEISLPAVGRIVRLAPSAMGLSLTENLRPKVACLMRMCDLSPSEVGHIVSVSPQTLILSQKGKVETTLRFLTSALTLDTPQDLGRIILAAPRVLVQGLETSIRKKLDMLTDANSQRSRAVAVAIVRKNPSLLVVSNAVLKERINRCPTEEDIGTWLLPSNKGRKKAVQQSPDKPQGNPILASPDAVASFEFLTRIYPSVESASQKLGISVSAVRESCRRGIPVNGNFLYSVVDFQSRSEPLVLKTGKSTRVIPVSLFCSGSIYPSDDVNVGRGQSRAGGLAIQVFTDGSSHDGPQFIRDFSAAAESCFGIRVPTGRDRDDSKLIAVFPLVNPSRNRCELFACSGALRILEDFLEKKRRETKILYDVKVYTDSNYAWKLVKSRDKLLELGSCFSSQEMLSRLDMAGHSVNIDILHPLARSFSRLNGNSEPLDSSHKPFDNANVEFVHSMEGISATNGGLTYVKKLRNQAKSAATWQFNRERSLIE